MSLRCRRTFLEVVEHVETIEVGSSRRHSCSGLEGLQQEHRCQEAEDKLLQKAADSFAWHLDIPISRGSYGHPEMCAAPCIRAFYSKCTNGVLCEFCHFGHTKAKVKLFKAQRQLFDSLEEATVLSLVLSLPRDKCKKLPATQQEVMRLLLAALQKRVVHLGQPIVSQNTRRSLQTLKKFSIGRLFEVVEQSRQVDAALKSEVRSLLMGARTMVQRLHAWDRNP